MKPPRPHPAFKRTACLLLAGGLLAAGAAPLRADDRVTVRGKSTPEYTARKFAGGTIRDETYVFKPGRFFGGTTRDPILERMKFIDVAKSLANDLVAQHYYPADSLRKADLLIIVEWGVTTVAGSTVQQFARDSPIGMGSSDAALGDTIHAFAEAERSSGATTDNVQLLDQGSAAAHTDALVSDAEFQQLDRKSMDLGTASNAALVGFSDDLRADNDSSFGTPQGEMLRAFMADERYFVAVLAYDCPAFLATGKFKLLWSLRLSMRAPGMDFRTGVSLMSRAGRPVFGQMTEGVQVKLPHEKSPHVEIGAPIVIEMGDKAGK